MPQDAVCGEDEPASLEPCLRLPVEFGVRFARARQVDAQLKPLRRLTFLAELLLRQAAYARRIER